MFKIKKNTYITGIFFDTHVRCLGRFPGVYIGDGRPAKKRENIRERENRFNFLSSKRDAQSGENKSIPLS